MNLDDSCVWPDSLEGPVAAPASHRVLLEGPVARVLEVIVKPGAREPEHTHRHASVMIVDQPARIRYYEQGQLTFESPVRAPEAAPRATWMEPEGPHSVENIDAHPYHAFRIELKAVRAAVPVTFSPRRVSSR